MAPVKTNNRWYSTLLLVCLFGCLDPYQPPITDQEVNFLVVDGFVNTSEHTVNVTLSRAVVLWKAEAPPPELNAQVVLEEKEGSTYILTELGQGKYSFSSPSLTAEKEYRLYIHTQTGQEYRSAYITPKTSPPIDEVNWNAAANGINLTVGTHDPSNENRYYRWEFTETWAYKSAINSAFKLVNGIPVYRSEEEQIHVCYRSLPSTKIYLASTDRLSEARVNDYGLVFVETGSQKLSVMYSILVQQYSLSKEAYIYWDELRKTTESLGSLFDPQPSRVSGNIINIANSAEPVIGYFDGGSTAEKRIFIRFSELPDHVRKTIPQGECVEESIDVGLVSSLAGYYLLTSQITVGITVVGYRYTTTNCADCRHQGGTTEKPDFWP